MAWLAQSVSARGATADITAAGTLDWLMPASSGPDTFNRKTGGGSLISTLSYAPDSHAYNSVIGDQTLSWSDGDVTGSGTSDRGMYNYGTITFTVPADTTPRRLFVFAGCDTIESLVSTLTLSDASASTSPVTHATGLDCLISIDYAAASSGQTLTVALSRGIVSSYIYLNGVALALDLRQSYSTRATITRASRTG